MDNSISSPCVGNQLRIKREEQRLTLEDVASHLRLKKELINDIENGNYTKIPLTYLRGYLRSYAKLVALSEAEVLLPLGIANHETSINGWKIFSSHKQITSSDKLIQWITFSIISVLVLLVALWWKSDNLLYKNLSVNDSLPDQRMYQMADNSVVDSKK